MGRLLSFYIRGAAKVVIAALLVLVVLMSGDKLSAEWRNVGSVRNELPLLQTALKNVDAFQESMVSAIKQDASQMSTATVQTLDTRIQFVDHRITTLRALHDSASLWPIAMGGGTAISERLQEEAKRRVELELRQQERAYLVDLRGRIDVLRDRQAAGQQLERLRVAYLANVSAYNDAVRTQARVKAGRDWVDAVVHYAVNRKQDADLENRVRQSRTEMDHALAAFRVQKRSLELLPHASALASFQLDERRLEAATSLLRERVVNMTNVAAGSLTWRAYHAAQPWFGTVALLIVGWFGMPAAIRTVFYYILAPLAAHAAPVVIDRRASSATVTKNEDGNERGHDTGLISRVSIRLTLTPAQEMLIRPEYCQSLSEHIRTKTKLLFDWSYWLPSIAAHLWMLNRMSTDKATDIVLSSTMDPLEELALLEIEPGKAFVMQPRGLVGVLYSRGQRPRIRSHWRLGTLHAWLTFQLRYLSFEGPATLVVKGCRGVRLETALAGRTISQDATLGFSAHAIYTTVRSQPFLPYALGRQALLHDRFAGQNAFYLYEEIPRNARPGYRKSNPLEVLFDAGLKALGI